MTTLSKPVAGSLSQVGSTYAVRARDEGGWIIVDRQGSMKAGPFARNADAWRWLDGQDPEAVAHEEQRKRIGAAIGQW